MEVEIVDEKLRRYKSNYLREASRINSKEMPKIKLNYRTDGRKSLRNPLKRLLDEAKTGLSVLPCDG